MKISIVITGRHYNLTDALPDSIDLPEGATVDDALNVVAKAMPAETPLPASCLVAVGERHLGTIASHEEASLSDGDEVILIAPVSGG